MDRERKLVTVRFALGLTDEENNAIAARDELRRGKAPALYALLEDYHPVTDVTYYSNVILYTVRPWNDTEEQHNLIANDIESYIEGLETLMIGLDSGEEM